MFVPVVLHGDGVKFTMKNNSLMVSSMSFLLGQGFSSSHTFLLWVFAKVCKVYASVHGADSHDTIWKYIVHGFQALFAGVHSPLDPDGDAWPHGSSSWLLAGKPIADGMYRAICWLFAMDMDQASNEHGWAHFNATIDTCGWCPANRTYCNIRDVSANALWKTLLYVPGPSDRPVSRHRIWTIPGTSRFTFMGDLMHGGDLGPLLHLHGSTIDELTHRGGPMYANNKATSVQKFVSALQSAYEETGTGKRMQSIVSTMIRPDDDPDAFPELKVKAAESRHLVKAMISILKRPEIARDTDHDGHRLMCYMAIDKMYDLVMASRLFMTAGEATLVLEYAEEFLVHYNWLATEALDAGDIRWGMTVKFHFLWHIAWFARYQAPRACWCYSFEDFIGKIQACAMSCTIATPMHLVPQQVFENYTRALSLSLEKFSR